MNRWSCAQKQKNLNMYFSYLKKMTKQKIELFFLCIRLVRIIFKTELTSSTQNAAYFAIIFFSSSSISDISMLRRI